MKGEIVPADLSDLAARINAAHQQCERSLQAGLAHALEAGRLLREAKERVEHGGWLAWVEEHCRVSRRTAQLYMLAARRLTDRASPWLPAAAGGRR